MSVLHLIFVVYAMSFIAAAIVIVFLSRRISVLKRENAELKRSGHIAPVELQRPPIPHWSTANNDAEVLDLMRRGEKIQAIKLYRERTGVGLKEAKDAVEAMEFPDR